MYIFQWLISVSYTHLDVYKRQICDIVKYCYDERKNLLPLNIVVKLLNTRPFTILIPDSANENSPIQQIYKFTLVWHTLVSKTIKNNLIKTVTINNTRNRRQTTAYNT